MNQRLQELYLDAAKHMEIVQQQGLPAPYQTRAFAGKYAELILKECIICAEREWIRHGSDSVHNKAIHKVIESIKEHFGVEE